MATPRTGRFCSGILTVNRLIELLKEIPSELMTAEGRATVNYFGDRVQIQVEIDSSDELNARLRAAGK